MIGFCCYFWHTLSASPHFQADLNAGRSPSLQINVDATAMSQAFMGAGYIARIVGKELAAYRTRGSQAVDPPIKLVTRSLFNPNLDGGWFLAVIQIVNNITILAIVLTGTALLREREHGTLDHLLVLPLTPLEIMLSKIGSNALVVVGCTWLSLEGVVRYALDVPLTGSMPLFLVATAVYLFAANSLGSDAGTLHAAIRPVGNPGDYSDAVAVRRQYATGKHARMASMGHAAFALHSLCQPQHSHIVP